MSRATLSRLANHRFFATLDFQHDGTLDLNSRVATKKLTVDQSAVEIKETAFSKETTLYAFTKTEHYSNYIMFWMDPRSERCKQITGNWKSPRLNVVHTEDDGSPKPEDIFSDFLRKLKDVFTSSDFENLIQKTLSSIPQPSPSLKAGQQSGHNTSVPSGP